MKPCYIANIIFSILYSGVFLAACTQQESDKVTLSAKKVQCSDWNYSGVCDNQENVEVSSKDPRVLVAQDGPYLQYETETYPKNFMSAPEGALLFSPYTTLIENELLFNPALEDSTQTQDSLLTRAINQLDRQLPLFDFASYLYQPGPSGLMDKLQSAIERSVSKFKQENPYCIAAAVIDRFFLQKSRLDINSQQEIQAHCVAHSTKLSAVETNNQTLKLLGENFGSANLSAISSTGKVLVWQAYKPITVSSISSKSMARSAMTLRDHDNDDDDDDDDDNHDGYTGATGIKPPIRPIGPTPKPNPKPNPTPINIDLSKLNLDKLSVLVSSSKQHSIYVLQTQENTSDKNSLLACVGDGKNSNAGIHKLVLSSATRSKKVGLQSKNTPAKNLNVRLIDAYSSATALKPLPDPPKSDPITKPSEPEKPNNPSSAQCYNNSLRFLALNKNETQLVSASADQLFLLNAKTLKQEANTYQIPINESIHHISLSNQDGYALITSLPNHKVILLDLQKRPISAIQTGITNAKEAYFINKDQHLLVRSSENDETLEVISRSKPQTNKQTIVLDSAIKHLSVAKDGRFFAVLTENDQIQVFDSSTQTKIATLAQTASAIKTLLVSNHYVYLLSQDGSKLQTLYFGPSFGGALKQVAQKLTLNWVLAQNQSETSVNKPLNLPKSFAEYPDIAIYWSSNSNRINLQTGAVNTDDKEKSIKLTAEIRGTFRGNSTSINKAFNIRLKAN